MPYGKGTYGKKKGRPSKSAKAKMRKTISPAMKAKLKAKNKKIKKKR